MASTWNYQCGTDEDGAPSLALNLVVSTTSDPATTNVAGTGAVTNYSTRFPTDVQTTISGAVSEVNGGTEVSMTGTLAGQQNFQGALQLPSGWGEPGTVTYSYVDNNGQRSPVGPVPATPIATSETA